jgi:hypothetical protein
MVVVVASSNFCVLVLSIPAAAHQLGRHQKKGSLDEKEGSGF